jgi:predicted CoA-binding protein
MEQMLKLKTWAVVGATNNEDKFGYKIFKMMKDVGFEVYPVNPGVREIDGQTCYSTLQDLPVIPEAVDMVVQPRIGDQVVRQCAQLGIKNVWFQPGADSKEIIALARQLNLQVVYEACIMVELRKRGGK